MKKIIMFLVNQWVEGTLIVIVFVSKYASKESGPLKKVWIKSMNFFAYINIYIITVLISNLNLPIEVETLRFCG